MKLERKKIKGNKRIKENQKLKEKYNLKVLFVILTEITKIIELCNLST